VTPPARKPAREAGRLSTRCDISPTVSASACYPEERVTPRLRLAAPTPGDVIASTGIQAPWNAGVLGAAMKDVVDTSSILSVLLFLAGARPLAASKGGFPPAIKEGPGRRM
jgi:hypothetical protein